MQEEKIFLRWIWQILSHGTQQRKITQALTVEGDFVLFPCLVCLQAKKTVRIRTHPWHFSTDHKLCTLKTSDRVIMESFDLEGTKQPLHRFPPEISCCCDFC